MRRLAAAVRAFRHPPVLVFQMGKVGSSAVRSTLAAGWPGVVDQAHAIEQFGAEARAALDACRTFRLRHLVISPVRDPLSRNVSAFFENFTRDTGLAWSDAPEDPDALLALFLARARHENGTEWFDRRMRPAFGLDVYATPFDHARRAQEYRAGAARVLVYRSDLGRDEQLALLARFTGRRLSGWVRQNEASDKAYAARYGRFIAEARLPAAYADEVLASRFARHFWTDEERAAQRARWVDGVRTRGNAGVRADVAGS